MVTPSRCSNIIQQRVIWARVFEVRRCALRAGTPGEGGVRGSGHCPVLRLLSSFNLFSASGHAPLEQRLLGADNSKTCFQTPTPYPPRLLPSVILSQYRKRKKISLLSLPLHKNDSRKSKTVKKGDLSPYIATHRVLTTKILDTMMNVQRMEKIEKNMSCYAMLYYIVLLYYAMNNSAVLCTLLISTF